MDEARMDRAMSRIEAALGRIETAARNAPAPSPEREDALRRRVSAALAELDTLIAGLER